MRLWFMGSGRFAARCFLELSAFLHFEVVVVPPPKPAGRGLKESLSPLEEVAKAGYGPLIRARDVNREPILLDMAQKEPPDVIVVVDFGQRIKEPILSAPAFGCINIHPSLLPAYRGAAPIQRAIIDGKEETGVTIFRLVNAMDAGPILAQRRYPISPDETAGHLCEALACEGSRLLLEVLEGLSKGSIREEPQDESEATYAPKIAKEEALIRWDESSKRVHDLVRALNPTPGAFTFARGKTLKIWRTSLADGICGKPGEIVKIEEGRPVVACGEGGVVLLEVQQEGKAPRDAASWWRGARLKEGDVLG